MFSSNLPIFFTILALLHLAYAVRQPVFDPPYTQSVAEFQQKTHINARMEKLLGCWLYITNEFQISQEFDQSYLPLLKSCLRVISRKDAVLKITSLGNKNAEPVRPFSTVMQIQKIEIENLPQNYTLTEFDEFVLVRIRELEKQMRELQEKGSIKDQIEQEIQKRQKYYFGFIPANTFTHAVILVSISLTMMCCITWCKFYRSRTESFRERRLKQAQQRELSIDKKEKVLKKLVKFQRGLEKNKKE